MSKTELTNAELEDLLGPIGAREYDQAPEYDRPKLREWAATLSGMSDWELVAEGASHILDAAIMGRFPRQNSYGIDCRVTGIYREASRRHEAAGHDSGCRGSTLYTTAHNRALASQGHGVSKLVSCTCGKGE